MFATLTSIAIFIANPAFCNFDLPLKVSGHPDYILSQQIFS